FASEALPQIVVELGKFVTVGFGALEIPQKQPLSGKVSHERIRLAVCDHPFHLLIKNRRIFQFPLSRQVQKLLIRDAAPEEKRQARCQFEIIDPINAVRRNSHWIGFRAEQEFWGGQQKTKSALDAGLKGCILSARLIEAH